MQIALAFIRILIASIAYRIRGGMKDVSDKLPNWPLQLAPRLLWGFSLALCYASTQLEQTNLWACVWLTASGFLMTKFVPHRYVMTAGRDAKPPVLNKPKWDEHWPTAWIVRLTQEQWDKMSEAARTWHHSWQISVVVLIRATIALAPVVWLTGQLSQALLATSIIVLLVPVAHYLGFRVIGDRPEGEATQWEELLHGAVWGLAFSSFLL